MHTYFCFIPSEMAETAGNNGTNQKPTHAHNTASWVG